MQVTCELPDRTGWILESVAERRGLTLDAFLTGIAENVVTAFMRSPGELTLRDRVIAHWHNNIPDAVIAHRTGEPIESVRVARRSAHLPPRKFRREDWEHELNGRASVRPSALTGGAR